MKPKSQFLLALALAAFLLTGSETKGASENNGLFSHHHATERMTAATTGDVIFESDSTPRIGESGVSKSDRKKLLAGIGYLYAGFLMVLFFCELGIRKEKPHRPTLYLVEK